MNSVILGGCIGFVGKIEQTSNGFPCLTFGIRAKRNTKNGGRYDNFKVICYGNLTDYATKYFAKGDYVLVNGVLSSKKSMTKEGAEYWEQVVFANDIESVRKTEESAKEAYTTESKNDGYIDVSKSTNNVAKKLLNETEDDEELPF